MTQQFTDQVVLVNGASGGVGQATVKLFAARGARVVATGRTLAKLRTTFGDSGGITLIAADFTDERPAKDAIGQALAAASRIDHVVDCAGVVKGSRLDQTSLSDWQRLIAANLTAPFLLCREAYPALKATKGSVVLMGSVVARNGGFTGTGAAYGAAKAGVANLVRYLAKEWAPDRIRVNALSPGPIDTPMLGWQTPEQRRATEGRTLVGRYSTPEECAEAIAFLCSRAAGSMTGAAINISAGLDLD
ncbi:MAG: SDR family oxidoreductase [Alphaproteobacteria bacterium]|nr:SDR family oxidoreductase [Alphaproteobacteria bacterium]